VSGLGYRVVPSLPTVEMSLEPAKCRWGRSLVGRSKVFCEKRLRSCGEPGKTCQKPGFCRRHVAPFQPKAGFFEARATHRRSPLRVRAGKALAIQREDHSGEAAICLAGDTTAALGNQIRRGVHYRSPRRGRAEMHLRARAIKASRGKTLPVTLARWTRIQPGAREAFRGQVNASPSLIRSIRIIPSRGDIFGACKGPARWYYERHEVHA
jgi:hypothetical protein